MKEYVGVIREGGLWSIELLPKDIGGRACKELHRIM